MKPVYFILITLICHLLSATGLAQSKVIPELRIPVQQDFQSATLTYGPPAIKNAIGINFGIDALLSGSITGRFKVYAGIGYFRNQIHIHRLYDHTSLNTGHDSLPIGLSTINYTCLMLRVPIGVEYIFLASRRIRYSVGLENNFNYGFSRFYNGDVPYAGANRKYSEFKYSGNSVNFLVTISKKISVNQEIFIQPYCRILNIYHTRCFFV